MSVDLFEQNLALLEVNSPGAARAVRAAGGPPPGVEFFLAKSGDLTARHTLGGAATQMHSAYDPRKEADQFVRKLNLGFGHWVAWFGPGLWHGVAALMQYLFHCPICVFEAEPGLLRAVLEVMDMKFVFGNPGLRVYTGSGDEMIEQMSGRPIRIGWGDNYVEQPNTFNRAPETYRKVRAYLVESSARSEARLDPENVVSREAFGDAAADIRLLLSTTHRYAESVGHVIAPHGAEARPVYAFKNFEAMEEFNPAFYLMFTENLRPGPLKMLAVIRELGIPAVMWNLEDPKFFKIPEQAALFEEAVKLCDHVFTHSEQFMHLYPGEGPAPVYLPTGARPDMFGEPAEEREMVYDYSFFGFMDEARVEFFDELKSLLPGLKSRVCGPGMAPEDYREMIRRTRVNLTVFTTCDEGGELTWALSDRVWEIPYAGGFLLQDHRRSLDQHFGPGEAVCFTDARDCAEKIRYYVAHPDERAQVLGAARRRVGAEHLWAHRVEKIVSAFFAGRGK